jgi:hypothetical protein
MKKILQLFLLNSLFSLQSFGQDTTMCDDKYFKDDLLDKLTGQWKLSGEIGKRKVENNFSADWVLNHQFIELKFTDVASPPAYSGNWYIGYDCISERYVLHLLDNFGGRLSETPGYGTRSGQSIEFRFEYPDGPFINKLMYDAKSDSWQLHMTQKNAKGEWVVFGDEYLKRR